MIEMGRVKTTGNQLPQKTNLNKVKQIARIFVYVDIETTEFAPAVVKHPFTDSGIAFIPGESGGRMLNLLDNEDDLKAWHQLIIEIIDRQNDVFGLTMMVCKSYRLQFFQLIQLHLSPEDFGRILRAIWTGTEFITNNPVMSQKELIKAFRRCDPEYLMEPDDYNLYKSLPDVVEVYRGIRTNSLKVRGMSWTTDKEVAVWFAKRFSKQGETGRVLKAFIRKADILAIFNDRGESEVVLNPDKLIDLVELESEQ